MSVAAAMTSLSSSRQHGAPAVTEAAIAAAAARRSNSALSTSTGKTKDNSPPLSPTHSTPPSPPLRHAGEPDEHEPLLTGKGGNARSLASATLRRSRHLRGAAMDDFDLGVGCAGPYPEDNSCDSSEEGSELFADDSISFPESSQRAGWLHRRIRAAVLSPVFDQTVGLAILLNAITIGLQTDLMARQQLRCAPPAFRAAEVVFCIVFTFEVSGRLFVHRKFFFTMVGRWWNIFDMAVVSLQLTEELMGLYTADHSGVNWTYVRFFRLLRLIRVIRVFRILRIVGELRKIASSIISSMKAFSSTVVLLFMFIYLFSVYFTQLILDYRTSHGDLNPVLDRYYGSLGRTIISLFASISGGLSWLSAVEPLMDEVSPCLGFVFSFYVAFSTFAMMNVVTGVFVESVMGNAKQDTDVQVTNELRKLLASSDCVGSFTWDQFQGYLRTRQMKDFFKSIDLDISEARGLFQLFDVTGTGYLKIRDFLESCFRLRRPARALELLVLMREIRCLSEQTNSHSQAIEKDMTWLRRRLQRSSSPQRGFGSAASNISVASSNRTIGISDGLGLMTGHSSLSK